jgi:hypothetical protein
MKKPDPLRLAWLERRWRREMSLLRREAGYSRQSGTRHRLSRRARTTVLPLPTRISADQETDRANLQRVLNSLLNALHTTRARVKLDFSRTVKMFPGGMLLLLAYLELLLKDFPGRISAKCAPGSLAAQLLSHFHLADRLGIDAEGSRPSHHSVVTWKYLTGSLAEGEKIRELLNTYRGSAMAVIPEGLYDVLSEALINVRHHAYPESGGVPPNLQRWWLFSRFTEPEAGRNGSLFIAIYDIGIGIQQSLRNRLTAGETLVDHAGKLLDLFGLPGAKAIERTLLEAAVEGYRSGTGLAHRGYGLPEMREFVLRSRTGTLSIISGNAQYTCLAERGAGRGYSCGQPVLGTLILWNLPLLCKEAPP